MICKQCRICRRHPCGFTLIDVMIATIIIGLGISALMMLMGSGTRVNDYGRDLSTAVFLVEQIRSLTEETPYDQLTALNGRSFTGADGNGNSVAGLGAYTQQVVVEPVNPVNFAAWAGANPPACRITVVVSQGATELTRVSWLRVSDSL